MSNPNNNNGDMQDYLDLLDEYGSPSDGKKPTEAVSLAEKRATEGKMAKPTLPSDVVDEDFFEDEPKKGDIDAFFEGSSPAPAKKAPAKQPSKKPSAPPMAKPAPKKEEKKPEPVVEEPKTEPEDGKKEEKNIFKLLVAKINALPKKKRIILGVVSGFLAVILVLVTIAGVFIGQKFSLLGDNTGTYTDDDTIYEDEEVEDINIDIGSSDFKQSLIDWATTGNDKHMYSKNVINVLLIGADSRRGKNEGNTDVMMLVSVNRKTKELKMVSFLRDSYLYIEGNNNSYCTKLNAAYSMGGPECLMKTIENNYKIEIDNYVMVNFESFKAIVNEMGGITVDVQEYEADYINKKYKVGIQFGENVTLNGKQALAFCRVRNCDADGDVSRTRRQRQVIDSMVERVIDSSVSEINKYIDTLLPYVDTGYSKSQILSLGLKAITGGWAKYERTQLSVPNTKDPSANEAISGSANMWIWVVDYQQAAYNLQMELYGESNIVLDEDRTSIIDVYRGANYSSSSTSIKDNNKNETEVPNTTEVITTQPQTTVPQTTQSATTDVNNEPTEALTTQEDTTVGEEPSSEISEDPTDNAEVDEPVEVETNAGEQEI